MPSEAKFRHENGQNSQIWTVQMKMSRRALNQKSSFYGTAIECNKLPLSVSAERYNIQYLKSRAHKNLIHSSTRNTNKGKKIMEIFLSEY